MGYLEEDIWTYIFKPICSAPMQNNNYYDSLGCITELGGGIIYILGEYHDDIDVEDEYRKIESFSDSENILMKIQYIEDFSEMEYDLLNDQGIKLMLDKNIDSSTILSAEFDEEDDELTFKVPRAYIGEDVIFKIGLGDSLYTFAEKIIYVFKAIEYTVASHLKSNDRVFTLPDIVEEIENNVRNKDIIYSNSSLDSESIKVLTQLKDEFDPMNKVSDIIADIINNIANNEDIPTITESPMPSSDKSNKNVSTALLEKSGNMKSTSDIVNGLMKSIQSYLSDDSTYKNGLVSMLESTDVIVNGIKKDRITVPSNIIGLFNKVMANKGATFALGKKIDMDNNGRLINCFTLLFTSKDGKMYSLEDYDSENENKESIQTIYDWYVGELIKRGINKEDIKSAESQLANDTNNYGKNDASSNADNIITIDTDGGSFIDNFQFAIEDFTNGFVRKNINPSVPDYIASIRALENAVRGSIKNTIYDTFNKCMYSENDVYEIDPYYEDLILIIIDYGEVRHIVLFKDEQESDDQPPKYSYHLLLDHNLAPRAKHLIVNLKRAYGSNLPTAIFMNKYGFQRLDLTYLLDNSGVVVYKDKPLTDSESFMMLKNALIFLDCALNLRIIDYMNNESHSSVNKIYDTKYQVTGKYNFSNVINQIELMVKNKDITPLMIDGIIKIFELLSTNYFPYNDKSLHIYHIDADDIIPLFREFKEPTTLIYTDIINNCGMYYDCTNNDYYVVDFTNDDKHDTYGLMNSEILTIQLTVVGEESLDNSLMNISTLMVVEDFNTSDHKKCKEFLSAFRYAKTLCK